LNSHHRIRSSDQNFGTAHSLWGGSKRPVSELAFGGDDWENFVHENGEDLESFSNTVDDLTTGKTLSKNLLHLQEIQLVGVDQESIKAGPSKLQRSTGDSFMTKNI
jgi:hypothetical protein